jgi:DNA-binding HxlR family transcriptional regulator
VAGRRNYNQDCPIANGLDVLGERWTLLIVRELVGGPRRYSDLRAQMPGIATNLLAQRLDELEQAGVVERTELPAPIARTVYTLSDDGWRLVPPILGAVARFGSAAETSWRSFGTVADKSTRKAFLASARAVVGPRGQMVSAKQHFPKFDTTASLLIWGGRDMMIPASHTDNVRREVPNIRVEIFPSAGHFPQLDEPELFFRVLDEFLRSEPPAPENCASVGRRNGPWV